MNLRRFLCLFSLAGATSGTARAADTLVFHIDAGTGRLTRTGDPVAVPAPFCERFLPIR